MLDFISCYIFENVCYLFVKRKLKLKNTQRLFLYMQQSNKNKNWIDSIFNMRRHNIKLLFSIRCVWIFKPFWHMSPYKPSAQPWVHVPFTWWHEVPSLHSPQLKAHSNPYVIFSQTKKKIRAKIDILKKNILCDFIFCFVLFFFANVYINLIDMYDIITFRKERCVFFLYFKRNFCFFSKSNNLKCYI